jgi:hypothetical protein
MHMHQAEKPQKLSNRKPSNNKAKRMTWRHRIISALTIADGIIIIALVYGWNNFQKEVMRYPPSSFNILLISSYVPILAVIITLFIIGALAILSIRGERCEGDITEA